jgi:hypothetical protein
MYFYLVRINIVFLVKHFLFFRGKSEVPEMVRVISFAGATS